VLLLLIWAFESTFSIAQTTKVTAATATTAKAVPQNLLLADDGLAVIAAALDARNRFSNKLTAHI